MKQKVADSPIFGIGAKSSVPKNTNPNNRTIKFALFLPP